MMFIDLEEIGNPGSFEADLCIAGSGPAGVSIAKEFAGSKVRVLIIEGGGTEQSPPDQAPSDVENIGAVRDTPQDFLRNRIVGGYSHIWGGRCVSLDDIDFESRAWIPGSGWPLLPQDIHSFLDRSKRHFGIGPNIYDDRLWKELGISPPRPRIDPALLQSKFWQYSSDERNSREPTRFFRTIAKINAPNVRLLMHANITHINTSEDGARVKSLEVSTLDGRRAEVKANAVVLACGGLENARLLLASNKIAPKGVGNSHDLVGRFLMLHPGCKLGWFDPHRSTPIRTRFGHYLLDHEGGKNVYAFGLMLSPEIQRKEQLLNCAALLEQAVSTDNAWNALRRLVRPGADQHRTNVVKDVVDVVGNLPSVLSNAYRRFAKRQGPILRTDELSLMCFVEQTPDPSNRVTLAQQTDALGMPLLRIDWRIGELELRSVMRFNELIGLEFRRAGLPEYFKNSLLFEDMTWRFQFLDRAHPSGTTRMSDSPKQGVVDRNCKVHEVNGLYIAGSSVFPTAGHANPTLTIVALAIRLADWLKCHDFANI